jgi:hypothetical protein
MVRYNLENDAMWKRLPTCLQFNINMGVLWVEEFDLARPSPTQV